MSERDHERKEKFERVRSDFDELNSEEKVIFLLEASVTTIARGIDAFGRAVSDEINSAFSKRKKQRDPEAPDEPTESEAASNGAPSTPGEDAGPDIADETPPVP